MATIYTKTALKKIKKDALVEMFLDLQAQKVDHMMDEVVEKCCTDAVEEVVEDLKAKLANVKKDLEAAEHTIQHSNSTWQKSYEKLEEENKKLKKRIEEDHKAVPSFLIKDLYIDAVEENKKLKEQLKEPKELFMYKAKVKELREENQVIKEKNEDLNRTLDDVNYVPFNPNYTEKAILEFIRSCPINIVEKIKQSILR